MLKVQGYRAPFPTAGQEFSIANSRGAECMHKSALLDLHARPAKVMIPFDCSTHITGSTDISRLRPCRSQHQISPWVAAALCFPTTQHHHGTDGSVSLLLQTKGADQGDANAGLLFSPRHKQVSDAALTSAMVTPAYDSTMSPQRSHDQAEVPRQASQDQENGSPYVGVLRLGQIHWCRLLVFLMSMPTLLTKRLLTRLQPFWPSEKEKTYPTCLKRLFLSLSSGSQQYASAQLTAALLHAQHVSRTGPGLY